VGCKQGGSERVGEGWGIGYQTHHTSTPTDINNYSQSILEIADHTTNQHRFSGGFDD